MSNYNCLNNDKDGRSDRVRNDLLQHEIITEDFGGEVLCVDVSALTGKGLDKLEEAIMLQAELLELKANPDRHAEGIVVEAKVERGKGSVATVLVKHGTLKMGDIFVVGAESGRVRALLDDRGKKVKSAGPGQPVEILGLYGTPFAGDSCIVVDSVARAREILNIELVATVIERQPMAHEVPLNKCCQQSPLVKQKNCLSL